MPRWPNLVRRGPGKAVPARVSGFKSQSRRLGNPKVFILILLSKFMAEIDIHHRKERYLSAIEAFEQNDKISSKNRKKILNYMEACNRGQQSENHRVVSEGKRQRYLQFLRLFFTYVPKDFDKVNKKDVEKYYDDLKENRILQEKNIGRNYEASTKDDLMTTVQRFYTWVLGKNDKKWYELVGWIGHHAKEKTVGYLTEIEVSKMLDCSKGIRDRVLIQLLYDSGARIEEFLNLKRSDVEEKTENNIKVYYITIRNENSKTKGRTIALPMPSSTKLLDLWLQNRPNMKPNDPLFDFTYSGAYNTVKSAGFRALGKRVWPHLLRHSSATHYADLGMSEIQQDCRYGWEIGSKQPRRYISRSGILERQTVKVVQADEFGKINQKNENLQTQMSMLTKQVETLRMLLEVRKERDEKSAITVFDSKESKERFEEKKK